jgi:trk system potassium uptake protein TrkA
MFVLIIGGGQVGYYLAKGLMDEGHEVLIIEENPTTCERIRAGLGSVVVRGDGSEPAILEQNGAARADILAAVTGDDEDNLVACQVAKQKFKVARTIARIRNPKNELIFQKLGIDVSVSSTKVILEHITEEVPTHPITHLMEIRDSGMEIVEVKVSPKSRSLGKEIQALSLPAGSAVILVIRKGQKPFIPAPSTVLNVEDHLIAVTVPETEAVLQNILR